MDGRFVPDEDYERGPMIVYPKEAWAHRSTKGEMRYIAGVITVYGILWIILIAVNLWVEAYGSPEEKEAFTAFFFLLAPIVMVTMLIPFYLMRARRRGMQMGLYEKGIQNSHATFIPYEEIDRLEPWRVWRKGTVGCYIHVKRGTEPTAVDEGSVRMISDFLGEEGMQELESRVHGSTSPE